MDLTLLYAICAESIGIHPLIVFFRGHAYPAFWLKEYSSPDNFQDDKNLLTKSMASGIHDIIAVESTLLTNEKSTFHSAVQSAESTLNKPDYFDFFVDNHRSRIGQIKPLSLKNNVGSHIQIAVQPAPRDLMRLRISLPWEKKYSMNLYQTNGGIRLGILELLTISILIMEPNRSSIAINT
ncbi:hypothetical protein [Gracilibacillus suaedae]|uniref:hypothetical protein n=1 Tax=Gracilibacillus suaedae TaxID=2820273 RepID=UPI001ABE6304|nr:hypothetical protein [Gracilibacillus suaedae]